MLCSGVALAATLMLALKLLLRVSLSASLALLWRSAIRCLSVCIPLRVDLKPRGHAGAAKVRHDLGVKPQSVRPQSTVHSPTRGLRQVQEGVALPEQLAVRYRSSTREQKRRFRPLLSSHVQSSDAGLPLSLVFLHGEGQQRETPTDESRLEHQQ
jgi:hypothetical protein